MSNDPPLSDVARQVLSYFVAHPQAADDVEGIAHWRLLDELARVAVEDTARAVDELVSCGLLTCDRSESARPRFRLNRAQAVAAAQMLSGRGRQRRRTRARPD